MKHSPVSWTRVMPSSPDSIRAPAFSIRRCVGGRPALPGPSDRRRPAPLKTWTLLLPPGATSTPNSVPWSTKVASGVRILKPRARSFCDFHGGLAHLQPGAVGREQLEGGRALQDDLGADAEVDLGHARCQAQRLAGGQAPGRPPGRATGRSSGNPCARTNRAGEGRKAEGGREEGAGRGGDAETATSDLP